jgi:hypothetical protein
MLLESAKLITNLVLPPIFQKMRTEILLLFLWYVRDKLPKDLRWIIGKRIYNEMDEVYFERDDGRWKITKSWKLIKDTL